MHVMYVCMPGWLGLSDSVIASWPGCLSVPGLRGGRQRGLDRRSAPNEPAGHGAKNLNNKTQKTPTGTPHGPVRAPKSAGPAHDTKSTGCAVWCNGCVCASIQASFLKRKAPEWDTGRKSSLARWTTNSAVTVLASRPSLAAEFDCVSSSDDPIDAEISSETEFSAMTASDAPSSVG